MSEDISGLVAQLVSEQIQTAIDTAVKEAVDKTTIEITERLKNDYETRLEHELMVINDPTKTDGAVYETDSGEGYAFGMIEIDLIDYNPKTDRTEDELSKDSEDLAPLIADVEKRGGIIRPLLVYRNKKKPGRYVLIKGHRRLAALKALDEELVQAYIMPAKPPASLEDQWVNGF